MGLIYQLAVHLAGVLIRVIALFNRRISKRQKGISESFDQLRRFNPESKPVFWMHCASLGEFEQGRPILEQFKAAFPKYKIVLTFFSPSGYEARKDYPLADLVVYLPWDTPAQAKRFAELLNAEIGFFVKYEIWPNIISAVSKSGTRLFLASARFRKDQIFFKAWGGTFRNALRYFEMIFVQDESSVQWLKNIAVSAIRTGDTRYDRVLQLSREPFSNRILEHWSARAFTIVAGSTWPKDEQWLKMLLDSDSELQIILAPHEIGENHLNEVKRLFGSEMSLLSTMKDIPSQKVIIVDSIGMLNKLYRFGQYAYIGGGFGKGIHNTLEAVVYGIPVVFGPNYFKFQEAHDLLDCKAAVSISSYADLLSAHRTWRKDAKSLNSAGKKALELVEQNRGSTEKIMKIISGD